MVNSVSLETQSNVSVSLPPPDARIAAQRILQEHTQGRRRDISEIRRDLDALAARDPALGAAVRAEVEAQLTVVEQGQLASAAYGARAPDGGAILFRDGAPTVDQYRTGEAGTAGRAFYARMDRMWGDGNAATDDTARIEAGLRTLQASGVSFAEFEAARAGAPVPAAEPTPAGPDTATLVADLGQMGLDIVGIFDPTGIADGANAGISVGRAIGSLFSGNLGDAAGHLGNGAISAAGILIGVGDLAKLGKVGKWAQTVTDAIRAAAGNPAVRAALEPALRKVYDALTNIPAGALDKLPASAREGLERMKTELDTFFGVGARRNLSDVPVGELTRQTILDNLDTLDVATRADSAIFYSGRGAREAAERNAAATGRTTLESTDGGRHLDNLRLFDGTVPDVNGDAAMEIWGQVSTRYAQQASGSVSAFVNNPRPTSVFLTQELPALLANSNVTQVVVRGGNGAEVTIPRGTTLDAALAMINGLN